VKTARLFLAACAGVSAFGLVPAVSAAEEMDGGARSGGAKALPVVPSHGGASEALPDESAGLGGAPIVPQPPPVVPAPDGAPIAAEAAGTDTETAPEDEVVVPLDEDEGSTTVESDPSTAQGVQDESGSLPFTGLALVSLVVAGLGLLLAGLTLRRSSPPRPPAPPAPR
jgi:hypothetical protein